MEFPRATTAVPASRARKGHLRESVESLVIALVIFLVIRTFAFQAFRIPTGSMENTLLPGDFLFVNKFAYGAKVPFTRVRLPGYDEPDRGDIIVFQCPADPTQDYIKRCVGIGGDVIEVRNKELFVNGVKQEEDFVVHREPQMKAGVPDNLPAVKVPPGQLWMMGDNRDSSYDSRYWGPVEMDLVRGKAWVTYFSWDMEKNRPRVGRMFRWIK